MLLFFFAAFVDVLFRERFFPLTTGLVFFNLCPPLLHRQSYVFHMYDYETRGGGKGKRGSRLLMNDRFTAAPSFDEWSIYCCSVFWLFFSRHFPWWRKACLKPLGNTWKPCHRTKENSRALFFFFFFIFFCPSHVLSCIGAPQWACMWGDEVVGPLVRIVDVSFTQRGTKRQPRSWRLVGACYGLWGHAKKEAVNHTSTHTQKKKKNKKSDIMFPAGIHSTCTYVSQAARLAGTTTAIFFGGGKATR